MLPGPEQGSGRDRTIRDNKTWLYLKWIILDDEARKEVVENTIQVTVSQGQRAGRTGKANKRLVKRQTPMKVVPNFIGVLF